MKNTDKLLFGIVCGVLVLVLIAFAVAWLRPKPSYQADDTPHGVVHNYLLALRQSDYTRAHSYLSPTLAGYPASALEMSRDIQASGYSFRQDEEAVNVMVDPGVVFGTRADVTVRETLFYQGGLLGSHQYDNSFSVHLQLKNGRWKITDAGYYWVWCWSNAESC